MLYYIGSLMDGPYVCAMVTLPLVSNISRLCVMCVVLGLPILCYENGPLPLEKGMCQNAMSRAEKMLQGKRFEILVT